MPIVQLCDFDRYIVYLQHIPDVPLVRCGVSWRMALKYCYQDCLKGFITRDLPAVCEEYHLYHSMNLQYKIDESKEKLEAIEDYYVSTVHLEQLLKGRALLGEPEDLDF